MTSPQDRSYVSTFDDDVPPAARRQQPTDWSAYEESIASVRIHKCRLALQQLLGGRLEEQPRVAIALSGGGTRAMTGGVAFLDLLATPFKKENLPVINGESERLDVSASMHMQPPIPPIKPLDTVSHIASLSGGSWITLLANTPKHSRNYFHYDKRIPSDKQLNPWLYGPANAFDASTPNSEEMEYYTGLKTVLSEERVRVTLGEGNASYKHVTLAAATLGGAGTKVENYSHFLANQLLGVLHDEDDNASLSYKHKLSALQQPIREGNFPFIVCSAVANKESPLPSDSAAVRLAKHEARYRRFDWIEITPFYIRNPTTRHFTEEVDESGLWFIKGKDHEDEPDARRYEIRLHQVLAMTSTAFAADALDAGLLLLEDNRGRNTEGNRGNQRLFRIILEAFQGAHDFQL